MGILERLVGTPEDHAEEKEENAVVSSPEFDVTQYAKKLAVVVGVIVPASIAVAKAAEVDIDTEIVVGSFVITAAALLAVSLVMAVDIGARAYAVVQARPAATPEQSGGAPIGGALQAPPGLKVWLADREGPHSVLAVARGADETSYLVVGGSSSKKRIPGHRAQVDAYDEGPVWVSDDAVTASALAPRQ
jgi:hypothetical protein